ncbi:MAG TPA: glycosyltransferase family 9 protein, partial [Chitinophagales bacterium]|nr:glycosyltransferase family 9 protein [Chitinophagales bacterium]
IFNGCGKFSLNQSASLLKSARLVITHDTGLMHIAAALRKKIISVWGNTVPEFGMYPYYGTAVHQEGIVQIQGLPCRPCSKIGFEKCPKGHFRCMQLIDENEIVKMVENLLVR